MKTSRSVFDSILFRLIWKKNQVHKEFNHLYQEFKDQNFKVCFDFIIFRLILRHLQHLDINCHQFEMKKNEMHKAKGQVVFVYDDDWTLLWKISSGKNQNDMINGDVLKLDFRTKILTSKCGLLTNVLSRAMHFLMIIHNDEMWYYILYLSHEDIILKRFTYTQNFFLSKLTVD